jgi:glycosyltransferase involved in cell wall biosynthesis
VAQQIDSILSCTYQDIQLYIYDDGSKDGTVSILKDYENRYPDKVFVHENAVNLGVTTNFLQALSKTTQDYIMLCDQDDVWKPEKIAMTLKRMRHMESQRGKETPLAVFTDAVVVDSELKVLQDSFFKSGHLNPCRTDLPHLLMENKLIGCTVMVNSALRKILKNHSLPKEAKFHDWWLALIAASFGKIGYLKEGTLFYRQHGGNVVGNTSFLSYFKNRVKTLQTQKQSLLVLQNQADEFLKIYQDLLTPDTKIVLERFANLHKTGFIKRRVQVLHYGYLKTGILRNIGLMFVV